MPYLLATITLALWSSMVLLATKLNHLPPFLVLGACLLLGGSLSLPRWRSWNLNPAIIRMGVFGIFGYHFALFMALRHAPAVEATLLNSLWALLIVLLSPIYLAQFKLQKRHILGGVLGFSGAAIVILGGAELKIEMEYGLGYLLALSAAVIWARYSLLTRRSHQFSSATVGLFCIISGVLALLCHQLFEVKAEIQSTDMALLALLGIGPMGISFYCWDAAMKHGDPRKIGAIAYFMPLLSTAMLVSFGEGEFSAEVLMALILISSGAVLGTIKLKASKAKGLEEALPTENL